MDRIRVLAVLSVRRACGFAALAIVTVMVGLAADPVLSIKSGAVLTSFAVAVLFWKALEAPKRNYRHTELWIMLERAPDIPESHVGRFINNVLHEVYLWHAERAAVIAFALWLVVFISQLLR
jgi:hypothetical protein